MWIQALCLFLSPINRLKGGNGFPTSVPPVSNTRPCAICLLRKCFCSRQSFTFASLPSDTQAQKADNFPTWDQWHRKANISALC